LSTKSAQSRIQWTIDESQWKLFGYLIIKKPTTNQTSTTQNAIFNSTTKSATESPEYSVLKNESTSETYLDTSEVTIINLNRSSLSPSFSELRSLLNVQQLYYCNYKKKNVHNLIFR
jgi:hypothetical protein